LLDLNSIELKPITDKNAKFYSHLVNFSDNKKSNGDALLSNDLFPIWYYHKEDENWENLSFEEDSSMLNSEPNENQLVSSNVDFISEAPQSEISTISNQLENSPISETQVEGGTSLDLDSEVADSELLTKIHGVQDSIPNVELVNNLDPDSVIINETSLDLVAEVADSELLTKIHDVQDFVPNVELANNFEPDSEFSSETSLDLGAEVADSEILTKVHDIKDFVPNVELANNLEPDSELITETSLDLGAEVADSELLSKIHDVQDFVPNVELGNNLELDTELNNETSLDLAAEVADNELHTKIHDVEDFVPNVELDNNLDLDSELINETSLDLGDEVADSEFTRAHEDDNPIPVLEGNIENIFESSLDNSSDFNSKVEENIEQISNLEENRSIDIANELSNDIESKSEEKNLNNESIGDIDDFELIVMLNELGIKENVSESIEIVETTNLESIQEIEEVEILEKVDSKDPAENEIETVSDIETIFELDKGAVEIQNVDIIETSDDQIKEVGLDAEILEIDTPFVNESELLQHTNEDILNEEINGLIDLQEAQLNLIEPDSYDDGKIILYIQGKLSPIDINNVSIEEIKEKFSKKATLDVISPSLSNSEFLEKLVVKDKKRSYLYEEMEELNDFNKWLLKLTPISEGNIATIKKAKKKYKKKKKKFILEEGIANSIRKNNALVSESLAQILANQGHNAKAIEMYNQLILNYPEKSVYFAAQIEKLKTD
jgi:hypothetical protein